MWFSCFISEFIFKAHKLNVSFFSDYVFAAGSRRVRAPLPHKVRTTQLDSVSVFFLCVPGISFNKFQFSHFKRTLQCLWVGSQSGILSRWLEGWNLRHQLELVYQTAEDGEMRDWDRSWCMPSSDPQTDNQQDTPHSLCCFS